MDEEGNTIDSKEIDPKLLSSDYYNQVVDQTIDNFGNRTSKLITFNDKEEMLCETVIVSTL